MFGFKRDNAGGRLGRVRSYRIYYGPASDEARSRLLEADLVILEPRQWSPGDIAELRRRGVAVYGYLAVMESAEWDERRMAALAPADILKGEDGAPVRFEEWNSVLMDLRSAHYRSALLAEWDALARDYPISGVFLDTVGDIEEYVPEALKPDMGQAYRSLLAVAAGRHPGLKRIQNRGFSLLEPCLGLIDGCLWEGFDADSLNTGWSKERLSLLNRQRKNGLALLSSSEDGHPRHGEAARRLGFVHWTCPPGGYMEL